MMRIVLGCNGMRICYGGVVVGPNKSRTKTQKEQRDSRIEIRLLLF